MIITAFFSNVVVYDLFYKLDVKKGEQFTLVMDNPEEMDDVFVNNDKVLDFERNGTDMTIVTKEVGSSKIRIYKEDVKVRELLINVVDAITRPAQSLNATLGQPQPK